MFGSLLGPLVSILFTTSKQTEALASDSDSPMDVFSYPLRWHYNIENDKIFATASRVRKTNLFSLCSAVGQLQQKKRQKTASGADVSGPSPAAGSAASSSSSSSSGNGHGPAAVDGILTQVGVLKKQLAELRLSNHGTRGNGDGDASSTGPAASELIKPIVEQLADDPGLLQQLVSRAGSDSGSGGSASIISAITALIEAELDPENDEAHCNFETLMASDAAEVHAEAFEKHDIALAASLEDRPIDYFRVSGSGKRDRHGCSRLVDVDKC